MCKIKHEKRDESQKDFEMWNRNTGLEDVVLSVLNTGGRPTKEPNGQESKGTIMSGSQKKLSEPLKYVILLYMHIDSNNRQKDQT